MRYVLGLPATVVLVSLTALAQPVARSGQEQPPAKFTPAQQEEFLRTAKVLESRSIAEGVTNSTRVTLEKDGFRHSAHFQNIDVAKKEFHSANYSETNFKDTYTFNIAGYRLAVLLGIGDMAPVSVERRVHGTTGALTWWVDDVLMDEKKRIATGTQPPDQARWNYEMEVVRTFDQLIANTDRNLGNLLIDKRWRIWMIDHTRAFRMQTSLLKPENLSRCDRSMLERMRGLTEEALKQQLTPWVASMERKGLLARRDLIVRFFDAQIAKTSEAAVLFDRPKRE